MKVYNMRNSNGNKAVNQFELTGEFKISHPDYPGTYPGKAFQSYNSIIAVIIFVDGKKKVFLDSYYWNYSNTTSKFRNIFLNENKKETEKKIASKEYILTDLN